MFIYLICSILFILALRKLSSVRTAINGNNFAIAGIAIAVISSFTSCTFDTKTLCIIAVIGFGGVIGWFITKKIKMKDLPQLVAAFHSLIGLAAVCTDTAIFLNPGVFNIGSFKSITSLIEIALGLAVGAITFAGSAVACLKLCEKLKSNSIKNIHILNILLVSALILSIFLFIKNTNILMFIMIVLISTILGCTMIVPISGADMPVIVSMLNSLSGWAATGIGLTLSNDLLIIVGALVGTSGAMLSNIMCKGMNRKLSSVVSVGFRNQHNQSKQISTQMLVNQCVAEDVVFMLENTNSVIIVPGYGMAVSQAQHVIKELFDKLLTRGINVKFAIHPVAGRMPGHMNVLLAEANIRDNFVYELDNINSEFASTDIVIVVGANDTVNPSAKDDKQSAIYGMPVLEVWKAKTVVVIKRSLNPGYAGIDNALFSKQNTLMLLGDAKKVINDIVKQL